MTSTCTWNVRLLRMHSNLSQRRVFSSSAPPTLIENRHDLADFRPNYDRKSATNRQKSDQNPVNADPLRFTSSLDYNIAPDEDEFRSKSSTMVLHSDQYLSVMHSTSLRKNELSLYIYIIIMIIK